MKWSDSWQLMANTPTTWLELFIGFWILAASNRLETRNNDLANQQIKMQEQLLSMEESQTIILNMLIDNQSQEIEEQKLIKDEEDDIHRILYDERLALYKLAEIKQKRTDKRR